jgi:predicted GNAT superfamily acetyltransferase
VCTTYRRAEYGEMRDGLNAGLPSDRFQVDWWINTRRVERRLGKRSRPTLNLSHVARSGLRPFYSILYTTDDLPRPPEHIPQFEDRLLLAEIPGDFLELKSVDFALARDWRFFTRELFETAFAANYIVTDFIFDREAGGSRGIYLLTHGESTLDQFE